MARTTKFSNARGCVAEPEVVPVLAVPRGERIQPDFERVRPPIIQDRIQHVTPPRSGSAGTHHLIPAQAVVTSHGPRDTPALASGPTGPTIQELLSRSANSRKVKAESDRLDHACVRWRHTLPNRLIKQARRHIIIYSVASLIDDTLTRYQPSFTLSLSVGRCTVSRATF